MGALKDLPAFLSPAELAKLTGVHEGSIRRSIREGRIPADKISGKWMIPSELVFKNAWKGLEECLDQ